jgi:excisionase family DNA binding protein
MSRLHTVTDLATYLQVKPSTVYAWVAQRKIPHIRLGRLIRFTDEQRDEIVRPSGRSIN